MVCRPYLSLDLRFEAFVLLSICALHLAQASGHFHNLCILLILGYFSIRNVGTQLCLRRNHTKGRHSDIAKISHPPPRKRKKQNKTNTTATKNKIQTRVVLNENSVTSDNLREQRHTTRFSSVHFEIISDTLLCIPFKES